FIAIFDHLEIGDRATHFFQQLSFRFGFYKQLLQKTSKAKKFDRLNIILQIISERLDIDRRSPLLYQTTGIKKSVIHFYNVSKSIQIFVSRPVRCFPRTTREVVESENSI